MSHDVNLPEHTELSLKDLLKIKYFFDDSVKSSINIDVTTGGVPGGDGADEYG